MSEKREVTLSVRMLLNHIRRLTDCHALEDRRITPMQGRVIGFLSHNRDREVYQRDLEQEFQIRRSTISAILQTMEKNGLIHREPVEHDARLKKLTLTPQAEAFNDRFIKEMERLEGIIRQGVSQAEIDAFFSAIDKFQNNLKACAGQKEKAVADGHAKEEKA